MKYELYVPSFRIRYLIGGAWLLGLTLFISMVIVKDVTDVDALAIVHFYLTQVFMGLVAVSIVPGYICICVKMEANKKRDCARKRFRRAVLNCLEKDTCVTDTDLEICRSPSVRKLLSVPIWIILTFIVTFLFPWIMQTVSLFESSCYMYVTAQYIVIVGCFADASIYILMDKRMRRKFLCVIGWGRRTRGSGVVGVVWLDCHRKQVG